MAAALKKIGLCWPVSEHTGLGFCMDSLGCFGFCMDGLGCFALTTRSSPPKLGMISMGLRLASNLPKMEEATTVAKLIELHLH